MALEQLNRFLPDDATWGDAQAAKTATYELFSIDATAAGVYLPSGYATFFFMGKTLDFTDTDETYTLTISGHNGTGWVVLGSIPIIAADARTDRDNVEYQKSLRIWIDDDTYSQLKAEIVIAGTTPSVAAGSVGGYF